MPDSNYNLNLVRLGIDTHKEFVIYMRADCPICKSEGFASMTRLYVKLGNKKIIATLNVIVGPLLKENEASLSEFAWQTLDAKVGDLIFLDHLEPVDSMTHVRSKIHGNKLSAKAYSEIIQDVSHNKYSNIELAAFITACAADNMGIQEIIDLTQAMIHSGTRLNWTESVVLDKHCVGGLPGNRTTPIVTSIVSTAGYYMPKTSSRAITSSSGTADVMECFTNVDLNIDQIKNTVQLEGACLAWGGNLDLSPADDILIKIEKALDIDSEAQMMASVLSKKVSAGSTHVIIDIPVGPTAKIKTHSQAQKLTYYFKVVGEAMNLNIEVLITDGSQPVGRGIGPALEAQDVLAVLQNKDDAPQDLKKRALTLASNLLVMTGDYSVAEAKTTTYNILSSGQAYTKFKAICKAQGRFQLPKTASLNKEIYANSTGIVSSIDNRKLARVAKLSGAPESPAAGLKLNVQLGQRVEKGDRLFTIFSESNGELAYALNYLNTCHDLITIK